jgi:hypothetical protein
MNHDFMVLASSKGFVGFGPSTYSFFLAEYRTLLGEDAGDSVLVDGSKIGTGARLNEVLSEYNMFSWYGIVYT